MVANIGLTGVGLSGDPEACFLSTDWVEVPKVGNGGCEVVGKGITEPYSKRTNPGAGVIGELRKKQCAKNAC